LERSQQLPAQIQKLSSAHLTVFGMRILRGQDDHSGIPMTKDDRHYGLSIARVCSSSRVFPEGNLRIYPADPYGAIHPRAGGSHGKRGTVVLSKPLARTACPENSVVAEFGSEEKTDTPQ
jgi:hypothetical protein